MFCAYGYRGLWRPLQASVSDRAWGGIWDLGSWIWGEKFAGIQVEFERHGVALSKLEE